MRKLALYFAGVAWALAAVFIFTCFPPQASAADKWKATLVSSDAGSTQTVAIAPLNDYTLECTAPACYKTDTASSIAADCSKDFILSGEAATSGSYNLLTSAGADGGLSNVSTVTNPKYYVLRFHSGRDTYVAARAPDGGDPGCKLYQETNNPSLVYPR